MSRSPSRPSRKPTERRKKPRSRPAASRIPRAVSPKLGPKAESKPDLESCRNCGTDLAKSERALFVEEEVGRIFCSEECIASHFGPEIERLEKEYFRRLSSSDLSAPERENLAHLRWITLQEPDEVWQEKTLSGDFRYTLISEFQPGAKKVWCVCICLFLRGEPSFLFLAFPTRNAAMVNHYRRGERVEWQRPRQQADPASEAARETVSSLEPENVGEPTDEALADAAAEGASSDRLADEWTEGETYLAQVSQERSPDDIPAEEFELYQGCLEEALQEPDEVWSLQVGGEDALRLYHFIRFYPEEGSGVWYVIVARETDEEEQIEIMDAFPTRDASLVDRYRRGEREVGGDEVEVRPVTRVVH